ncbi:MLO-like protein 12, partial [Mucuna pruriens]
MAEIQPLVYERTLEETPTWAVAVVCFVLLAISITIEHIIHGIGKWFKKKHKNALFEALEKVKGELMLLGFLSLLLTVLQDPISKICVTEKVGSTWHPCASPKALSTPEGKSEDEYDEVETNSRKLLEYFDPIPRRVLATKGYDKCAEKGKVAFVSAYGIHQLHMFIFVLAIFHILQCIVTLALGRTKVLLLSPPPYFDLRDSPKARYVLSKLTCGTLFCCCSALLFLNSFFVQWMQMRRWKAWENETKTIEYQFYNVPYTSRYIVCFCFRPFIWVISNFAIYKCEHIADPERFRFARDTTFGRRHLNSWSRSTISLSIFLINAFVRCSNQASFFRQFFGSVNKVDYLTLRHGFVTAHLAPGSDARFDFQKYIERSLEEDFKVVVGISPIIWFFAVLFLLTNTHGWYSYYWLPFIPLIIILLVGAKLQMIITKMGLRITDRGEVVKGAPLVEPGDDLFWFNRPRLLLFLVISLFLFLRFCHLRNSCAQKTIDVCFCVAECFSIGIFFLEYSKFIHLDQYEFSINSCFHKTTVDIVIRLVMGVVIQVLCSYVTLPLYALVTQMGSTMKPTIFNQRVASALKNWHQTAKKHVKESKQTTPFSSRPSTPTYGMSPIHLLQRHLAGRNESAQTSPRTSNYENEQWDVEGSPSTSNHAVVDQTEMQVLEPAVPTSELPISSQLEIRVSSSEFSFEKRHTAG